jgi:hypothetical protein
MTLIASTCAYGGGGSYVTGFLGINYIVILVSFMVLALIYMLGKLLPGATRGKLTEAARAEIPQLLISVIIIAALLATSQIACGVSTSMARSLIPAAGVPSGLSPFGFADYYVGNLALNTGLRLLTTIYSLGITYSIDARIFQALGTQLDIPDISVIDTPIFEANVTYGYDAGITYGIMADDFFAVLAPLVTLTVGMLFLQYLALPIIQYTAFVVLLPIAIALRSLSFTGGRLRSTANAVLAIAIALYIIYPLTIAFDSYAVSWIFSPSNPEYGCTSCLGSTYALASLPTSLFSNIPLSGEVTLGPVSVPLSVLSNFLGSSAGTYLTSLSPPVMMSQLHTLITQISQFIFIAVVLFAVNISITIGFAMGLTRALDSGIEGAASFWSSL